MVLVVPLGPLSPWVFQRWARPRSCVAIPYQQCNFHKLKPEALHACAARLIQRIKAIGKQITQLKLAYEKPTRKLKLLKRFKLIRRNKQFSHFLGHRRPRYIRNQFELSAPSDFDSD
jgi:hypothetical protein